LSAKKYHIGKNGPAPCGANPDKPGGRACRFGPYLHGTEAQMTELWESEQEKIHGDGLLAGLSREPVKQKSLGNPQSTPDLSMAKSREYLTDSSKYIPKSVVIGYTVEEQEIAMRLGLEASSPLSYGEIKSRDVNWESNGCSDVRRYELEDGSVGYFKPFTENSLKEDSFLNYGTSSLGAAISEVNSYRLSRAMGSGFDQLVPETAFREAEGMLGTIQREVPENGLLNKNLRQESDLREDYRKAAILDFVIGNLDRHEDNFLFGVERDDEGYDNNRIRLIDNSFSFPPAEFSQTQLNASIFASNGGEDSYRLNYRIPEDELPLKADEIKALKKARSEVRSWVAAGTIDYERGDATVRRISALLGEGRISSFLDYYLNRGGTDPEDLW